MTGLECGHQFCKECWKEYLKTKIMDEGMGQVRLRTIFLDHERSSNTTLKMSFD
jgi:hypothetical protein